MSAGSSAPSFRLTTAPRTMACECRSITSSMRQSKLASASARIGAPVASAVQRAPSKRRTPCTPLRPLNLCASVSWRAVKRLTENAPASRIPASVAEARVRQMKRVGGVSESEANDVTVAPVRVSPSPQATIATPADSARMALRNAAGSAWCRRLSLTISPRHSCGDVMVLFGREASTDRKAAARGKRPGALFENGGCAQRPSDLGNRRNSLRNLDDVLVKPKAALPRQLLQGHIGPRADVLNDLGRGERPKPSARHEVASARKPGEKAGGEHVARARRVHESLDREGFRLPGVRSEERRV